jgi:hypothetical protein
MLEQFSTAIRTARTIAAVDKLVSLAYRAFDEGHLAEETAGAVSEAVPGFLAANFTTGEVAARDRATQWQVDMARAYQYHLSRARSPEAMEAATLAYERVLAAPPDFTQYRRNSAFIEAPRITLDREARARLRFKLQMFAKRSWQAKAKGKHAGAIQRSTLAVFDALSALAGKHGKVFPSLEGLAAMACCCRNTVIAAIKELELFGFITKHRRVKRVRGEFGMRVVQDSNAYDIHEPNALGRLGLAVYGLFVGDTSESNKQGARDTDSYSLRNKGSKFAPPNQKRDFWGGLKEQWEAT